VACNFQTGKKLLTQYEIVTQTFLFDNAVLAALMSGRKYDVIRQSGDYSRERNLHTLFFFSKQRSISKTQRRYRTQYGKDPPSDNAVRRWVKQFQETAGSVLRRKGAEDRALRRKLLIESRKCVL
jgi:hypothetical protein